jgi:hypothetical protein
MRETIAPCEPSFTFSMLISELDGAACGIRCEIKKRFFCFHHSFFCIEVLMRIPNVENQIMELGPEAYKIYFAAKRSLIDAPDSCSEVFSLAAQTVRGFWIIVSQEVSRAG